MKKAEKIQKQKNKNLNKRKYHKKVDYNEMIHKK